MSKEMELPDGSLLYIKPDPEALSALTLDEVGSVLQSAIKRRAPIECTVTIPREHGVTQKIAFNPTELIEAAFADLTPIEDLVHLVNALATAEHVRILPPKIKL